jgi:hypothetical protein
MATPIQNAPDRSSCMRLRFSAEVELLTLALSVVYCEDRTHATAKRHPKRQ